MKKNTKHGEQNLLCIFICSPEVRDNAFLDRIVVADSQILITSYERQIKQLEQDRVLIQEKLDKCGRVDSTLEETARTAFEFLANPYERWVSGDLKTKRLVLKATFSRPLAYHRRHGYRTAALSLPFLLCREFSDPKSVLVLRRGLNSNRLEQCINALQDWSIIFKSPPALDSKIFHWNKVL